MNTFFNDDGSPKYVTFAKASGRRPTCIQVVFDGQRTSFSLDGMSFAEQYAKAIHKLVEFAKIQDVSTQGDLLLSGPEFLKKYGLRLKTITVVDV